MPKSILVADDSRTIQTAIQMSFAAEDVTLTIVADGETALARAREGNFHVILCDHVMPGLDGYGLCEALKKDPRTAHIPVLLLTGSAKPYDDARAQAIGIDDHLAKPFDSQALIDKTMALANRPQAPRAATPPQPAPPTPSLSPFAPPPAAPVTNPFAMPETSSPFAAPVDPFSPPPAATVTNPFAPPSGGPFSPAVAASERQGPSIVVSGERSYGRQDSSEEEAIRPTQTLLGMPAVPIQPPARKTQENDLADRRTATLPLPPTPAHSAGASPSATARQASPAVAAKSAPPLPQVSLPRPPAVPNTAKPKVPPPPSSPELAAKAPPAPSSPPRREPPPPIPLRPETAPRPEVAARAESSPRPEPVIPARAEAPPVTRPGPAPEPPAPAVEGPISEELLRRVLSQASREMIERIVWEVVPDLAETIIREEIERLLKQNRG